MATQSVLAVSSAKVPTDQSCQLAECCCACHKADSPFHTLCASILKDILAVHPGNPQKAWTTQQHLVLCLSRAFEAAPGNTNLAEILFGPADTGPIIIALLCEGVRQNHTAAARLLRAVVANDQAAVNFFKSDAHVARLVEGMNGPASEECKKAMRILMTSDAHAHRPVLISLLCNSIGAANSGPAAEMLALAVTQNAGIVKEIVTYLSGQPGYLTKILAGLVHPSAVVSEHCIVAVKALVKASVDSKMWYTDPTVLATLLSNSATCNVLQQLVANNDFHAALTQYHQVCRLTLQDACDEVYYPFNFVTSTITYHMSPAPAANMSAPNDGLLNNENFSTGTAMSAAADCWIEAQLPSNLTVRGVFIAAGTVPNWPGGSDTKFLNGATLQFKRPDTGTWEVLRTISTIAANKITMVKVPPRTGTHWRLWKNSHFALAVFRFTT